MVGGWCGGKELRRVIWASSERALQLGTHTSMQADEERMRFVSRLHLDCLVMAGMMTMMIRR